MAMIDPKIPPPIPERVVSARRSSPKDKKRRSLPASPHHESRRRSSNRPPVLQPGSPEIITSLIETLSAISSPADRHFDSVSKIAGSHSTPASPTIWHAYPSSARSVARPPRSSLFNGSYTDRDSIAESSSESDKIYLRTNQIVNTSGRASLRLIPSDLPSKEKAREAAYEDILNDAYTIGTPSVEPGTAPQPSPKKPDKRKSLRSLRSAKSLKNLGLNRSTDSVRSSEIPLYVTKRDPEPRQQRLFLADSRSPSPPLEELNVKKKVTPMDAFDLLHAPDDLVTSQTSPISKRHYIDSENASSSSAGPSQSKRSSYNFPHQEYIPTRTSSKRHSSTMVNRNRRSRPSHSENGGGPESEADARSEQFHTPPQTPQATAAESEELSINRRIEQLKEQKAKRDQLSAEVIPDPTYSPMRISHDSSPKPLVQDRTLDWNPPQGVNAGLSSSVMTGLKAGETAAEAAPSPSVRAVPLRTDRNTETKINSLSTKPIIIKHSPKVSLDEGKSFDVPQRSNSKILKRLSQPTSPLTGDKSRKRFSISQLSTPPNRSASFQTTSGDSIDETVEDYLSSPRLSQKVIHPQTGRVISFSEVGDPDGSVVFCCVGMGLTRYITAFYDELAATLKLRLITPDRPGVGGSEPHADGSGTPLNWPDDVRSICEHRGITKFSILAHSAGAIYALATALRMPQHIRCRVHLLAPWIPPSQLSVIGTNKEPLPANAMPYSQRFLRSIPTAFLRVANSSFLGVTSNSITTSLPRSPRRSKRRMNATPTPTDSPNASGVDSSSSPSPAATKGAKNQSSDKENRPPLPLRGSSSLVNICKDSQPLPPTIPSKILEEDKSALRCTTYEYRLASSIWDRAILNANPSVDLLVCLERRQPIGFRYVDITRSVVIHHGSKDSRVPVENVKWLGKMMRRCEVRVLEGEGHGLMANASVMGNVLMEMAREWEDWIRVIRGERKG